MICLAYVPDAQAGGNSIGVGAHYWKTLKNIDDEFDDNGVSYSLFYQRSIIPMFLKVEAGLEYYPDDFAYYSKATYAPQAYVIGSLSIFYAALGIGINYSDSEWADDPFYALRAGLDIPIIPTLLSVDINANYRFMEWDKIKNLDENLDTDVITLGAAVKLSF
jgi:hypothetical protein